MTVRGLRRGSIAASRVMSGGPLTQTFLTANMSGTDVSSQETGSFTPTAGSLILLWCVNTQIPASTVTATASNGMTITPVATVTRASPNDTFRLTLFKAVGIAVAGTVTFTFTSGLQTGMGFYIHEYKNLGTPVLRQSRTDFASSGTTGTMTFSTPIGGTTTEYAVVSAGSVNSTNAFTPGTDFTELYDQAYLSPTTRLFVQHDIAPTDSTSDFTWANTSAHLHIAAEIGPS